MLSRLPLFHPRLAVIMPRAMPSTHRFCEHAHPFYELGLVMEGACQWKLAGRASCLVSAGQCVLLPPGQMHAEQIPQGRHARIGWLGFDAPDDSFDVLTRDAVARPWAAEGWFEDLLHSLERIIRELSASRPDSPGRCALAFQDMLILFQRITNRVPVAAPVTRQAQVAESAARYFLDNLDHPLDIAHVARYYGLCPAYFSTIFRRHHRVSPRQFVQQSRITRARDLLKHTSRSVKEIAATCGYTDSAHFCRHFRLATGSRPSACRSQPRI